MADQPGARHLAGPTRPTAITRERRRSRAPGTGGAPSTTGVSSAGLRTTALPAASAAAAMPVRIARGKFQGAITPTTPSGSRS